jgi:hypothetical protein
MKYAIIRDDGVTEVREDPYDIPTDAIELTDEQYNQLTSGNYVLQNKQIVINPNN